MPTPATALPEPGKKKHRRRQKKKVRVAVSNSCHGIASAGKKKKKKKKQRRRQDAPSASVFVLLWQKLRQYLYFCTGQPQFFTSFSIYVFIQSSVLQSSCVCFCAFVRANLPAVHRGRRVSVSFCTIVLANLPAPKAATQARCVTAGPQIAHFPRRGAPRFGPTAAPVDSRRIKALFRRY